MVKKTKTLVVDEKFFNNLFEKERRKMQEKIGISNLSQPNFTKMIKGLKIRELKPNLSKVNTRIKKNVRI